MSWKEIMDSLRNLNTDELSDMSDEELSEMEGCLQKELSVISHYRRQRIHGRARYHGQNF